MAQNNGTASQLKWSHDGGGQEHAREHSTCISSNNFVTISAAALSLLATLVLIHLLQLIRFRRKQLAHLARARIPLAGSPKLFAGHLNCTILRDDNLNCMHAFHEQHGKTYALFYGPDTWVATVDLRLIQRVFVSEGAKHVDGTLLRLPFVTEINESLAQLRGDQWRRARRLMAPSFTPKHMKSDNVFRDIERVCDLMMDLLDEHKLEANGQPFELDANYAFKRYSMEVIFRIAYGRAHFERLRPNERDQLIDWVDEGSQLAVCNLVRWAIMFGPLARQLLAPLTRLTALGACIRYVHSRVGESLEARRKLIVARKAHERCEKENIDKFSHTQASQEVGSERKLIDSLVESFESGQFDDGRLRANLFFMLLAGFETSANTLTFMFWLLASHQDKQDILRSELTRQGQQADYLDWVVSETLRLYPAVPAPIGRVLESDLEHEGHLLRRGMTVVTSIWSLHRWPEYWGADVASFKPERFGDQAANKRWPLRFFAFAAGPRYCIGQHLALAEIKAIATRLLLKYRVSLPPNDSGAPPEAISPNMIHYIIRAPVRLVFSELSS